MITKFKIFENRNHKLDIISEIKHIINCSEEKYYTVGDFNSDSIYFGEENDELYLIEDFKTDDVGVVVYGGYKYSDELTKYSVKYEKLDKDTLKEILNLLDISIDYGLINYSYEYCDINEILNMIEKNDKYIYELDNNGKYFLEYLNEKEKEIIRKKHPNIYNKIEIEMNLNKFNI